MTEETDNKEKRLRSLWILAMVNSGIWAISIIALIFVIQDAPRAKGLFVILGGGAAVSTALVSALRKYR
jgi:hypothetical protein